MAAYAYLPGRVRYYEDNAGCSENGRRRGRERRC